MHALSTRLDELAGRAAAEPAETRLRRYGPEQQVVARLEVSGPQRRLPQASAGVDVRGDGSTEAYLGRVRRQTLDPGEDAIAGIRRALLPG